LLNMGQILSIPFIIAAIVLIIRALKRPPVVYAIEEPEKPTVPTGKKVKK